MDIDPFEVVTLEMNWDGLDQPYTKRLTRLQLGELLLQVDDMAVQTEAEQEN
ncbi:hypothetical protein [Streptomyces sp. NBC_01443]|uniref:hypothetical protein n=1 Tax=Streptomyces sp. NBC_01443 TaxID=2903868 RepID=UPI0022504128|nr:hypothetical protein [Streptomyces sp. NBC_01443]MCX4627551.1 hypothetical protein [Streptomyces sp. NBC_01443]